ncbi:MAG: hypothetical protein HUJ59_04400 [Bacilli bacterium]|nr:hypothetical protein [Bacilli bacterium]
MNPEIEVKKQLKFMERDSIISFAILGFVVVIFAGIINYSTDLLFLDILIYALCLFVGIKQIVDMIALAKRKKHMKMFLKELQEVKTICDKHQGKEEDICQKKEKL